MTAPRTDRQSARRTLKLIFLLQGHTLEGLCLKQLAEALKTSSPNAYRDLEVMAEEGVVERIPGRDHYWRLTPRIVQVAYATGAEFTRQRAKVDEFEQRYTREPK